MTSEIKVLGVYSQRSVKGWTHCVRFTRDGVTELGWDMYDCRDELDAYTRAMSGQWNTGTLGKIAPANKDFKYEGEGWPWDVSSDQRYQVDREEGYYDRRD